MTRQTTVLTVGLLAAAALSACSDAAQPSAPLNPVLAHSSLGAPECKPPVPDHLIPLPIAPLSKRVDLGKPTFGNPTRVTNPLFPISNLSQVVLVGTVGGKPFRAETTLLPRTTRIDLGDRYIETATSQYVAYLDRRLDETALDWYAQADDGAVWYLGEAVANYEEGEIVDSIGTWLTCKDGPMAMIMPARQNVGDVFRVENIYPIVFEEQEITHVNQIVPGPLGPVSGAFTVQQLHLDGSYAPKIFAPGYGEFSTGSGTDIEALALAIPTDASSQPTPAELKALLSGSRRVFSAAKARDWAGASRTVSAMNIAWTAHQTGVVPRLLKPLMTDALMQLTQAVAARDQAGSRQYAVDVSKTGLDLLLRYRSRIDVDFARLDLWTRQLIIDVEAGDTGGVTSDIAILETILYRLTNAGSARDRSDVRALQQHLDGIQSAATRQSAGAMLERARRLQSVLSDRIRAQESEESRG